MRQSLSPHMAWLLALGLIMDKVRRQGWLAIEMDVSVPESKGSVFLAHPALMMQPYLDFARDLLRLRLGGFDDVPLMEAYVQQAITTLTKRTWYGRRRADPSLLMTIWLTLRAFYGGWAPSIACDFGRQSVPLRYRPDFDTLENLLSESRRMANDKAVEAHGGQRNLEAEADAFITSISR